MSHSANPNAPQTHPSDAAREATGPVAADSLAAESLRSSGGFAENENAAAMAVKGSQSTLNTTDTQAATALRPAESGAARERQDALAGAGADEKGTTGLKLDALEKPEFGGTHNLLGYTGGPTGGGSGGGGSGSATASGANVKAGDSDFGASGVSSGGGDQVDSNIRSTGSDFSGSGGGGAGKSSSSAATATSSSATNTASSSTGPTAGTGVRPHVDAAPNYTGAVTGSMLPEGTFKPKGQNLEDASVTQSIPQTKTFTGDVGGVNDPGRLAERKFEGKNTDPNTELSKADGQGESQEGGSGASQGQYDVLESERA